MIYRLPHFITILSQWYAQEVTVKFPGNLRASPLGNLRSDMMGVLTGQKLESNTNQPPLQISTQLIRLLSPPYK